MPQQPPALDIWKKDDDWTKVNELHERKKRQNRLNQRAHRRRKPQERDSCKPNRVFRVERFRLIDVPASTPDKHVQSTTPAGVKENAMVAMEINTLGDVNWSRLSKDLLIPSQQNNLESRPHENTIPLGFDSAVPFNHQIMTSNTQISESSARSPVFPSLNDFEMMVTSSFFSDSSPDQNFSFAFPLSSDHLLHLIHYNVFRALISNKKTINNATSFTYTTHGVKKVVPSFIDICDGFTVIQPKPEQLLPSTLNPTYSQMTIGHSSWFNMLPHPKLRDNLILYEGFFDQYEFCNDIFGEAAFKNFNSLPGTTDFAEASDDELTNNRKGLIVWGEPWDITGWEVMPGFLKKWRWLLEGCEELIIASNRWRAKRDEGPLELN